MGEMKLDFVNCDVCGRDNNVILIQVRDYRFMHPEPFSIVIKHFPSKM
jgi:hypothetical protein